MIAGSGPAEWDIRALAGHASRSLLTVEAYLARPAEAFAIATPGEYVRATRLLAADPAVAARGVEAGTALGDDPVAAVSAIADRVMPVVDGCAGRELVTGIAVTDGAGPLLPGATGRGPLPRGYSVL